MRSHQFMKTGNLPHYRHQGGWKVKPTRDVPSGIWHLLLLGLAFAALALVL
ncbi:MAG: hypothetical protein AAF266_13910 [Planctomycetota bacterium]